MTTPHLSTEKKTEKLRLHWQRVAGETTARNQLTPEVQLILNELENQRTPVEILRIWVQIMGESVASPSTSLVLKNAILGHFLRSELFGKSGTPQFQSLDNVLEFWKTVVQANRANLGVAIQFALRNVLLSKEGGQPQVQSPGKPAQSIRLWAREFGSFDELEAFFEQSVLVPLRTRLAGLPVDSQLFEITVF